jgi:hypothetical protein
MDYYTSFGDRLKVAQAQRNLHALKRMVQVAQYRVQDFEMYIPWPALIDSWQRDLDAAEAALEAVTVAKLRAAGLTVVEVAA